MRLERALALASIVALAAACAGPATSASPRTDPRTTEQARRPSTGKPVDPALAERLQRVMVPLVNAMSRPRRLNEVRVGILDDPRINAASGGNGEFFVTRGLLEKANDRQLAGVLAHEVAHDDLNHVAKAQTLGAGLSVGMVILDQILPGSRVLSPIAGTLIARKYGRTEEYEADRHGADILRRAGYPPEVMVETLEWLTAAEGGSSGGFFATHPATAERIEVLRKETRSR